MYTLLRPLFVLFALLTLLTGLIYPLLVTGIGSVLFPRQAGGSFVLRDGRVVGSALISQSFHEPKYFWGRLSATAPMPNNAGASSGSNFGPLNPALLEAAKARIAALKAADPTNSAPVPVDLVTASGSGLDPGYQSGGRVVPGRTGGGGQTHQRRSIAQASACGS
jgi:K+-transporting ATPase ATPase C chain